jgi:hypothetical protein
VEISENSRESIGGYLLEYRGLHAEYVWAWTGCHDHIAVANIKRDFENMILKGIMYKRERKGFWWVRALKARNYTTLTKVSEHAQNRDGIWEGKSVI